jgi:hypothetical protein
LSGSLLPCWCQIRAQTKGPTPRRIWFFRAHSPRILIQMAQPQLPAPSLFSSDQIALPSFTNTLPSALSSALASTPATGSSGNNTFLMTASPVRNRKSAAESSLYRPKLISTVGAKPACLVNASVTYVGNDQIYAFGGFDQFTDEGEESRLM